MLYNLRFTLLFALKRSSHTDLSLHYIEPVFAPQIHLYLNLVLVLKSGCIGRVLAHIKTTKKKKHCNQNAGNMTAACYWLWRPGYDSCLLNDQIIYHTRWVPGVPSKDNGVKHDLRNSASSIDALCLLQLLRHSTYEPRLMTLMCASKGEAPAVAIIELYTIKWPKHVFCWSRIFAIMVCRMNFKKGLPRFFRVIDPSKVGFLFVKYSRE